MGELLEEMEHAAHADHAHGGHSGGDASLGKLIGLTMAVLGVLLALCSALVGGARTELIATMVEQTGTSLKFQTISTKYRMLQAQLQQLHSLMPDPSEFTANEAALQALEQEKGSADAARMIRALRLEMKKVLNTVTPTHDDVMRFAKQIRKYGKEREAARAWAESYQDAVAVHAHAAEHYEWALLCAEIAIVIASIALLLQNRAIWVGAMSLGVASFALVIVTHVSNRERMHAAEEKIEETKHLYVEVSSESSEHEDDEKLLEDIERAK